VLVWGGRPNPEYVEPSGRTSTLYGRDGRAGCVALWRAQDTGLQVGLYHGVQAGMEDDPSALWCTVCEEHGTLVGHATLTAARDTRSGSDFCEECMQLLGGSSA
jgi:hypothetical protein